ncbi:efflux transporter outer membrane subunit [Hyphobacterium sp. HN65]|uniref:Efflux transporter outer membrane subunit n=1 Tax=Hyphobacterium lacteum TaxID=3116575 RepID=A0ABU7LNF6_9PROT|nr:efflux transporter outer membrane subunit [Hyphobacterium sp. HN65]MEE2525456.1 efflux transporter outer membrane subunit [Hyphobacterium sp. HN65]
MIKRTLLLSATAFVLASCASTGQVPRAADIAPAAPTSWAAGGDYDSARIEDWVATFGDVRLSQLIDEAVIENPGLMAAEARIRAARASARAANAGRLPSLSADTSITQRETNTASTTAYGLGLGVSWEADLWGRLAARSQAGLLEYDATNADFESARLSIAGQVSRAWFLLIEARLQTELAQRDVEAKERSLALIERRFGAGVSRSTDVRTFRSALASSQAVLASRQRAEAAAARSLEILLGRYPAGAIEHEADLPQFSELTGIGAPGELLTRRPDLLAAEARLEAAGLQAEIARDALLPSLTLRGNLDTGGADPADMFDLDTLVATVIGGLTAPIFQGGALRAERDRAEAAAEAAVRNYAGTVLAAWREAEDAIYADGMLAARVDALQTAYEQAAAAEELVIRQYGSGLATVFELLDAQSRRIAAEGQYISARRERATNRVDIYLAIGGSFEAPDLRNQEG